MKTNTMSKIREANFVDTHNGTNFQLWKMHMKFNFQSREIFSIVNGSLKKFDLTNVAEKLLWEKHDKHAILAILATIGSFHKMRLSIVLPLMKCGVNSKHIMINTLMSVLLPYKRNTTCAS